MRLALTARPEQPLSLERVHAEARARLEGATVVRSDLRGNLGRTPCEVKPTFRFTEAGTVDRTSLTSLELVFEIPSAAEADSVALFAAALASALALELRFDAGAGAALTGDDVRAAIGEGFADESRSSFWNLAAALGGVALVFAGVVLFGVLYGTRVFQIRASGVAVIPIALGIVLMAKPLVRGRY